MKITHSCKLKAVSCKLPRRAGTGIAIILLLSAISYQLFFPALCLAGPLQEKLKGVIRSKASSPPASAAYGSEIAQSPLNATSDDTTNSITVNAASSGVRVVVPIYFFGSTQSLGSVTDTRSNTYTCNTYTDSNEHVSICGSVLATGLQTGDTITLNWTNNQYSFKAATAVTITNSSSADVYKEVSSYGTSVNASNTVAANSVAVGVMKINSTVTWTSLASGWATIGSAQTSGSNRVFFYKGEFSSSGAQSPGGTLSAADSYYTRWDSWK